MTPNQEEVTEPEESQTTMLEHPQEGAMEDFTSHPEHYVKE
jgi:hypothetical protein